MLFVSDEAKVAGAHSNDFVQNFNFTLLKMSSDQGDE
jgi:hypothetical protein